MTGHCRACGGTLFEGVLLELANMPRAAQCLPEAATLGQDRGIELSLRQCACCGLVQLENAPVAYYRNVIRATAVSGEMAAFRERQFGEFVEKYGLREKSVVEIGCGNGDYLSIMAKTGAKCTGLEHSRESVEHCRRSGLQVVQGFVEDASYRIDEGPFDGFFMMSYLEHLPEPSAVLSGILSNLTSQAVGLVEVPNFDMMLRNHLYVELIADHLFYFTRDTLTALLSRSGFEVLDCQSVWHDYILSAEVSKRRPLSMKQAEGYFETLAANVNRFVDSYRLKGKSVAVWGAGHQAFTVLSICQLSERVAYVVDSADFKQGRFTPATHIPIVSPEYLERAPIDAIIVMAGSYSSEIVAMLERKYGKRIAVAIIKDGCLVQVP